MPVSAAPRTRVLTVEDDRDIASAVALELEYAGYEPRVAARLGLGSTTIARLPYLSLILPGLLVMIAAAQAFANAPRARFKPRTRARSRTSSLPLCSLGRSWSSASAASSLSGPSGAPICSICSADRVSRLVHRVCAGDERRGGTRGWKAQEVATD